MWKFSDCFNIKSATAQISRKKDGLLFSPFVLTTDLVLLLGSKVVLNVEGLADLLGRFALDHVCDSLAADVEKCLDVEVVGGLYWSAWLFIKDIANFKYGDK